MGSRLDRSDLHHLLDGLCDSLPLGLEAMSGFDTLTQGPKHVMEFDRHEWVDHCLKSH